MGSILFWCCDGLHFYSYFSNATMDIIPMGLVLFRCCVSPFRCCNGFNSMLWWVSFQRCWSHSDVMMGLIPRLWWSHSISKDTLFSEQPTFNNNPANFAAVWMLQTLTVADSSHAVALQNYTIYQSFNACTYDDATSSRRKEYIICMVAFLNQFWIYRNGCLQTYIAVTHICWHIVHL